MLELGNNGLKFSPFELGYFTALALLGADDMEMDKRDVTPQNIHPDCVEALLPGVREFYEKELPENRKQDESIIYNSGMAFAIDRHGYGDGFWPDKKLMEAAQKYRSDTSAALGDGYGDGKMWIFIE
ncbi:MAG: hypothetical protein IJ741_03535 [Schwartzia sp.]|nr:hypothetical protein [Schwartzia sp. (in: firmicutes)]